MNKKCVLLIPPLDHEGWFSMKEYTSQILDSLSRYSDEFIFKVPSPVGSSIRSIYFRVIYYYFIYPLCIKLLLKQAHPMPTMLHVLNQCYAPLLLKNYPGVVTCHDLTIHYHSRLSDKQYSRWIRRVQCMKRACKIFAVSQNTAGDLMRWLNISESDIILNYNGVNKIFRKLPDRHRYSDFGKRLIQYSTKYKLLLHVGSNDVYKNIPTILKALYEINQRGIHTLLIKVGDPVLSSEYALIARELNLTPFIIDLGRISTIELLEVYNLCDALLFPSLYEGFGLPVLEAQASGLPCILSDASSLPEVGGNAALYHSPLDRYGMINCINRVFNNKDIRFDIIEKGYDNINRFSWERHADILVETYRNCLLN